MEKIVVDATNQSLGRLASKIAEFLRGKHLSGYQPHVTPEVEVSVKNLKRVKFTGNKLKGKIYYRYSGYHSGIKSRTLGQRWEKDPAEVLRYSVFRMLPDNKTRRKIIRNLKVVS
ncbi:MAG: 50S ribosomal protein L13 [Candidatus Yanofskybacteria bacterium RIFCSPHIGHO2_02_FULL_43_22]|uniref:Large ribosomal subunit protein uL13 n=1 Tax=Candidatus Yanofskybacteria bacterium RIFCSPHIGHO2_02_FULL_43_22 TaxID=1802681 RepID=A0A1F8FKT3_9BACT|nr:MAG: 50S ribosomal protein L13 [Candidatus Yanofskybacteria bacterium RIFCSPHIGHO2_02_FULL_43_22]